MWVCTPGQGGGGGGVVVEGGGVADWESFDFFILMGKLGMNLPGTLLFWESCKVHGQVNQGQSHSLLDMLI